MPPAPRTTRLAPTPSGALHVGNARTFLATWALARREGWRVVLRLEDLDAGRVKEGALEGSVEDLRWLGLDWDGAPEVQSTSLAPYRDALSRLAARGLVFPCTRSRSEIRTAPSAPHAEDGETRFPPELRPSEPWPRAVGAAGANWRLRLDPAPEQVHDELLGDHAFDPGLEIGDMVLWTKADAPAYQLAVVVDDARHGVTDVVRGDDLLASAARQQVLARALGVPHARWWHLPLVHGADGKRLAKRHGAHSLQALRAEGVAAERVIGWCAGSLGLLDTRAPLSLREFVAMVGAEPLRTAAHRLRKEPTVFGEADLAWLRGT
ncbi:MAG: tRNA glutamyl-Q(34) synthetase GluQRS [Planctomycetota bacterium]